MRSFAFSFLLVVLPVLAFTQPKPTELVYPHLDAANSRWFYFSSACRPFGMVNLSPDTELGGAWGSGYRYDSKEIKGFSHIHAWQLSGVSVMPLSAKQDIAQFKNDYYSAFSHDKEIVKPGYHQVFLEKFQTKVELTSTVRVGFHRYTFPENHKSGVIINLSGKLGPCKMKDGRVEQIDKRSLSGSVTNGSTMRRPKETTVYFYIEFNTDIENLTETGDVRQSIIELAGQPQEVLMKVGISYVSTEQAKWNMNTELPHWDFDKIVQQSEDEWNEHLSRIKISGGTEKARRRFYTDLWHALQGRRIISDVNGKYLDNTGAKPVVRQIPLDENGKPKYNHHNSDSFWGAQWTIQTLWHLAYPERSSDFCNSLLAYYKDGGLIPRGPSGGNYTFVMTGASSTPFLVSAWMKGIRDFDIETAFEGMKKNHLPGGMMAHAGYEHKSAKWGGVKQYMEKGFVPYPLRLFAPPWILHKEGAGQTLEYAFQDYCLAQLAQKLGKKSDFEIFKQRSQNYRNLYNPETGWMHPKNRRGNWKRNYDPFKYKAGFVESNGAQMTWFVPHDYQGLAELMGGKDSLIQKLNAAFKEAQEFSLTSGKSHSEEREKEARRIPINYGNQPSIETAFIFNEVGAPWLTQKWSRVVVDSVYSGLSPYTGFNGDEDQGLMGSLSVLMKIGLFQLDGGVTENPIYQIGSPIFDRIEIVLSNQYYSGKAFTIEVRNNSPENVYVQSIRLNDKTLDRTYLTHEEIVGGGELVLEMGSEPNYELGKSQ